MTKADIVDVIAAATGLTKVETEAVVDGFISTVIDAMKAGKNIDPGFRQLQGQEAQGENGAQPKDRRAGEGGRALCPDLQSVEGFETRR